MKYYDISEFIQNSSENTIADAVDKKVSLLYDFCILRRPRGVSCDKREKYVREWLFTYTSEHQMTNALHGILIGNYTLDNVLKQKGYIS